MPSNRRGLPFLLFALLVAVPLRGDNGPPGANPAREFLSEAAAYAAQLKMTLMDDKTVVERIEKPLHVYSDSGAQGMLWAWGRAGRPKAFLEYIRFGKTEATRFNALTMTSADRFVLTTAGEPDWTPQRAQIEPRAFPDAPPPSADDEERRVQMKELAGALKSHEFWEPNNTRYDLTLLEEPVLRYQETPIDVWDGAAFVIANGSNPEIILLVEAIGPSLEEARWHHGFARMGSAELHVELNGQDVWHNDRAEDLVGKPDQAYWLYIANP